MSNALTSNPGSTTWFDDTFQPAEAPVRLTSGALPEIVVMDGFARGQGIVGRSNRPHNLIGVKLDSAGEPVRVKVELSVDDVTPNWWRKHVPDEDQNRSPFQGRMLRISSQGEDKGALYLARRPLDGAGPTRAVLEFDLRADQIDPEALVMIGVDPILVEGERDLLPNPNPGLRLDGLSFGPIDEPPSAQICGGDSRRLMLRGNKFALSPVNGSAQTITLELIPDFTLHPRVSDLVPGQYRRVISRVAQKGVKEVSRGVRQGMGRKGIVERALGTSGIRSWGQDMTGAPVELTLTTGPKDRLQVEVPGGVGPVVGGIQLDPRLLASFGYPPNTNWSVVR